MKIIFAIISVILLVAFKFIDKKLESASGTGNGGPRELPADEAGDGRDILEPGDRIKKPEASARKNAVQDCNTSGEAGTKDANDGKSAVKEKIDPRKLVIYSEIMKPKY